MKWFANFYFENCTNAISIILNKSNINKYKKSDKYSISILVNKLRDKHRDKHRDSIRYFSQTNSLSTNIKTKTKYFNEINDNNYEDVLQKERTFCVFAYANYSLPCLNIFQTIAKTQTDLKEKLQMQNADIPLIYKLDVNSNFELIKKFHIKHIPVLQLRHQQKLVVEISGEEVKETNIKNVIYRFLSYFKPLESIHILDDFIRRETELFLPKSNQKYTATSIDYTNSTDSTDSIDSTDNINSTDSNFSETQNKLKKKVQDKQNEMLPEIVLTNLELKHPCKTYSLFKRLELALKNFQIIEIKNLLNIILKDHDTYLDIHQEYNKLVAKSFVYLFDEHNISLEKITELKTSYLLTNTFDPAISKCITFKEPIIVFDDFKNKSLKQLTDLEQFFSQDNILMLKQSTKNNNLPTTTNTNTTTTTTTNTNTNTTITTTALKYDKQKEKKQKNIQIKYLSRIFRILAAKYFIMNNFSNSLQNAVESYKLTFPLGINTVEHNKSKVLIENIFLSLGAYDENVQKWKTQLEFLYTDKIFRVVRFPHTRAFRGGRPIPKRGKSGKWRWLSHEWKPRWLKKKTKLLLEEEWRAVPDKNVPFWN